MEIDLLRPYNLPQLTVEEMKVVEIVIKRPATLPQVITEVLGVVQVLPGTLTLAIAEYMLIELDIVHKISATIPLLIGEQYVMLKAEFDIGLITATIPPITKVKMVDC